MLMSTTRLPLDDSSRSAERSEFQEILQRVEDGSDEALWELVERYGPHIQRWVKRKLDPRLRSKFDSADFVQMVWASFFRRPPEVERFSEPRQLIGYLVAMATNKVLDEHRRRLGTLKYDVNRERSLQENEEALPQVDKTRGTPSQYAIAHERWRKLMDAESERNRRIVEMRIAGATYVEIAKELNVHERTVRKVIEQKLKGLESFRPRS